MLQTAGESLLIETPRQVTQHTHGHGCILAATIAAGLTEPNADVVAIVRRSIEQTARAILIARPLGKGISPADVRGLVGKAPAAIRDARERTCGKRPTSVQIRLPMSAEEEGIVVRDEFDVRFPQATDLPRPQTADRSQVVAKSEVASSARVELEA